MQRFIDNGDNTVTDNKTGLIWTKNTVAKDVNFKNAESAVAALEEGWRMPTVDELATLVDHTRYEPAIDVEAFPDTANDWYWTQTPCAWNEKSAVWVVDFDDGFVDNYSRDFFACVRAVRSGQ